MGDVFGNVKGNVWGNVEGDVKGSVYGDVFGNVKGSVLGDVWGNVCGSVLGSVLDDICGSVFGSVLGDVWGNVEGSVKGNLPEADRIEELEAKLAKAEVLQEAQKLFNYYAVEIVTYGATVARLQNLENAWLNLKTQAELTGETND